MNREMPVDRALPGEITSPAAAVLRNETPVPLPCRKTIHTCSGSTNDDSPGNPFSKRLYHLFGLFGTGIAIILTEVKNERKTKISYF
jgi:hypothetical protein